MQARFFRQLGLSILGCCLLLLPTAPAARAQASPTVLLPVATSRVEFYGAYSYFHPIQADINGYFDRPINMGALAGANFYFNKYVGVQAEGTISPRGPNDCAATLQGGPVARYQLRRVVPFAHVTGGGAKLGGPVFQTCAWGWGLTGGLGFDYVLPSFREHIAIRPVQADYEFNHVSYGPLVVPGGYAGGLMKMNAYRLSAGVVYRFGNMTPPTPVAMSCSVTPNDVYPGDPITVQAQTLYLDAHKKTTYSWHTTGGTLTGKGGTVQLDTTGLAPGNYDVTGKLLQGPRPEQQADCITHFSVKQIQEPPTISCSAVPTNVHPGEGAIITAVANSPQNHALTYSYRATSGVITGTGSTATLSTGGVITGTITITCSVVDDLGKSATATTSVQIIPPVLPPKPVTSALCSIAFDRDTKRPARVDNEAKGCLDDIALTLQRQSDSKLVIVGSHDPEVEGATMAAQRAVNTKLYLVNEKGIDASRIDLRSGITTGRRAYSTLVPPGATFVTTGTRSVDEAAVKATGPAYGAPAKKAVAKKAKKK